MRPLHAWVIGFFVLIASFASVLVFGGAASSTLGPTMRLDPPLLEIAGNGGETFSIDVLIDDVPDIGGFEFQLNFDDSIANLVIQLGPFLESEGAEVICINNVALGVAVLGCVTLGLANAPSGSGVVAVLDFTLKLPFAGTGQLFLQACNAADPDGVVIPLNGCKDGSFVVPTPDPVGGVALYPHQTLLMLESTEGAAGGLTSHAATLAAAGAVVTLLAVSWYVRRRRLAS